MLLAHFSRRFGTIYYEGMCPADAPFPYGILSLQVPAAFEGDGQAVLTFYERGKDSHSLIALLFAEEASRDDHALLQIKPDSAGQMPFTFLAQSEEADDPALPVRIYWWKEDIPDASGFA